MVFLHSLKCLHNISISFNKAFVTKCFEKLQLNKGRNALSALFQKIEISPKTFMIFLFCNMETIFNVLEENNLTRQS